MPESPEASHGRIFPAYGSVPTREGGLVIAVRRRHVPPRALAIAVAAFLVPVLSEVVFPGVVAGEYDILIWTTSLVPAFLLAYYRGLRGVAAAVAAGMAVLALTQATVSALGIGTPDWRLLLTVVGLYVLVTVALAVVAELLHRERDQAERLALIDPLTDLPNRRYAERTLDAQFAAAVRGRSVAVVLFDLDHFKSVNDRHGHKTGDEVLRTFGAILHSDTRRMDFSGRLGGEEFVSVLADCEQAAAKAFAERVRKHVAEHQFPFGQVTVSAGVAAYQAGMASYEVLLAAADRALYRAKREGRNRIAADVARPGAPARVPGPPAGGDTGGARILLVDDDADVLRAVRRILETGGHRVDALTDASAALERFATEPTAYDLVVTDVIMPSMSGAVLVDLLLPHQAGLRVVYMSGYVQQGGVVWSGLPGAVVGFVPKPIEVQELLNAVRDVLTRPLPEPAPAAET